jgi:flagellar motor component MotA
MNNQKVNFLKWLSITAIAICSLLVAEMAYSAFSDLASADVTFICYAILLLGVTSSLFCLRQIMRKKYHMKKMNDMSYIAQMLGLLGTVIGMSYLFESLSTVDDAEVRQELITTGMAVVLNTTIVGIVCSLFIYAYVIFLREDDK